MLLDNRKNLIAFFRDFLYVSSLFQWFRWKYAYTIVILMQMNYPGFVVAKYYYFAENVFHAKITSWHTSLSHDEWIKTIHFRWFSQYLTISFAWDSFMYVPINSLSMYCNEHTYLTLLDWLNEPDKFAMNTIFIILFNV